MNRPRFFIVLTVILWLTPAAQSHAQFGKGRPKAFGDGKAEPVWLLPPVEGPNLHYKTFQSASVKAAVSYVIYLPEEYETNKTARYPVVYWLHGKGAGQQGLLAIHQFFRFGVHVGTERSQARADARQVSSIHFGSSRVCRYRGFGRQPVGDRLHQGLQRPPQGFG